MRTFTLIEFEWGGGDFAVGICRLDASSLLAVDIFRWKIVRLEVFGRVVK